MDDDKNPNTPIYNDPCWYSQEAKNRLIVYCDSTKEELDLLYHYYGLLVILDIIGQKEIFACIYQRHLLKSKPSNISMF